MDIQEIAHLLQGVSDTPLLDAKLLSENCPDIKHAIERRLKHEPVSKIIGRRGFWKDEFITSKDVLDPRPDSEIIIESVLAAFPDKTNSYRILDIGTGSGCLLATLLKEYPQATGVAIDKSDKALDVARQNLWGLSSEIYQCDFMLSNWYQDLGKFNIIVSNPPYIPTGDINRLSEDVKNYDPHLALDGGADGLDAYKKLIPVLSELLLPNGKAFFEIGQNQNLSVTDLFQKAGFQSVIFHQDYGHIIRVLEAYNFSK